MQVETCITQVEMLLENHKPISSQKQLLLFYLFLLLDLYKQQ